MTLVLDTSVLFAALDAKDGNHKACLALVERFRHDLVVPAPVIPEVDYWIHQRLSTSVGLQFIDNLRTNALSVVDLERSDYSRIYNLMEQYADSRIGFVDAAVLTIVERLNEPKLATLDHRHFRMLRPLQVDALELLPAIS